MKNIDPRTSDVQLLKEWATRIRQLNNRSVHIAMSVRLGAASANDLDQAGRRLKAAVNHLRKFDWEKDR